MSVAAPVHTAVVIAAVVLGWAPVLATPPEPRGTAHTPPDAVASGAGLITPEATADAPALRPHVVTYRVQFKGMTGGDLILGLKRDPDSDGWIYETRANPNFLARLAVSANSVERGWFTVGPAGVQPQRYFVDDGTRETRRDSDLAYDWTADRATGMARGEQVELALQPGTQDPMSIRAHLMTRLQAGREIGTVPMIDGREIKHYSYRREGTARLRTALGELETVVYTSARTPGDPARTWKYWFAPSLGFVPVRIEQRDGSEARLTFTVREVDWSE